MLLVLVIGLSGCGEPSAPVAARVTPARLVTAAPPTSIPTVVATNTPAPSRTFAPTSIRLQRRDVTEETNVPTPINLAPTEVWPQRFDVTTYHGQALPTPLVARDYPPGAWLISDDQIVGGTILSPGGGLVFPTPEFMRSLPTITLPPHVMPTLVVGSGPLMQVGASIAPWQEAYDTAPALPERVSIQPDPTEPTSFTLQLPADVQDQFLIVFVRFGWQAGADKSYFWRINPAE